MASEIFHSGITLHGFTPVQRRECDSSTAHLWEEQEKEWTAARCHRLLRALTSRVSILKKELSWLPTNQVSKNSIHSIFKDTKSKAKPRSNYLDDDVDWTQAKKKIKRKYSGHSRKNSAVPKTPRPASSMKGTRRFIPGEVLVPTPILARARGEHYVDNEHPTVTSSDFDKQPIRLNRRCRVEGRPNDVLSKSQMPESLLDLRKTTSASRYTIYAGIYHGLEALLRSTSDVPQKKRARSLFSTCIRAVPRYIYYEEALLAAHSEETSTKSAIDTRDISREIYDELQELSTSPYGWKQLKFIVRAHGIEVLKDAIREGLLDYEFVWVLLSLCIHSSATEEAESLLSAFLSSNPSQGPKSTYDLLPRPISMLRKFVEHTGRYSFQYQQLANLVSTGMLPLGWLATKDFRSVWMGVMQQLSLPLLNTGVLSLLEATLPLLAGASLDRKLDRTLLTAVKQTYSSLLTTLLSIFMLNTETQAESQSLHQSSNYPHIVNLLKGSLIQHGLLYPSYGKCVQLVTANMIAREQASDCTLLGYSLADPLLDRLWDAINDADEDHTEYTDLVTFICSVAHCCNRGSFGMGAEYLEKLHAILEKETCGLGRVGVVQGVIVDSALAFAKQVPGEKHREYATILDTKYAGRDLKMRRSIDIDHSDKPRSGYRWEEGICEWVTATPNISSRKSRSLKRCSSMMDDTTEPPSRPPPCVQEKIEVSFSDESDDELSFFSASSLSSQDNQETTNMSNTRNKRQAKRRKVTKYLAITDSEDELCI